MVSRDKVLITAEDIKTVGLYEDSAKLLSLLKVREELQSELSEVNNKLNRVSDELDDYDSSKVAAKLERTAEPLPEPDVTFKRSSARVDYTRVEQAASNATTLYKNFLRRVRDAKNK